MEVTAEMRAAVYADDCKTSGHIPDYSNVFIDGQVPHGVSEDTAPHIFCIRCKRVWLVDEESAPSYDEAETALFTKLKTADAKRVKGIREKRVAKRKERERLEQEQQAKYLADLEAQSKQMQEEAEVDGNAH